METPHTNNGRVLERIMRTLPKDLDTSTYNKIWESVLEILISEYDEPEDN